MTESPAGWRVSGSGEKGWNKKWDSSLCDHSLAVVGYSSGIEALNWSNQVSIYRSNKLAATLVISGLQFDGIFLLNNGVC